LLEGGLFDRYSQGVGILYFSFIFLLLLNFLFRQQIMKVLSCLVPWIYEYLCPCLHNCVNRWLASYPYDMSIKSRDLFSDLRIAALRESYSRAKGDLAKAPQGSKEAQ